MLPQRYDLPRRTVLEALDAALAAVDPWRCTAAALTQLPAGPVWLIAAGKAADGMLRAVLDAPRFDVISAVVAAPVVRPHALIGDPRVDWFRAGHPMPDAASLAAGAAAVALVDTSPPDARFLVLLSGGASALLEQLRPGVALVELRELTTRLLMSGLEIDALNRERTALSQLKGGGLGRRLGARPATVLFMSDVAGNEPACVGSGPCFVPDGRVPHHCIADNGRARAGIVAWATASGLVCRDHGALVGDAAAMGGAISQTLRGARPGLHVWGGECTVRLPTDHGHGGRCQQLVLAAGLAGLDADTVVLACGTDGRDGPGQAAGALVDPGSVARIEAAGSDPRAALARCDAGPALADAGDLVDTGLTGTNVADLVIALKGEVAMHAPRG